jgi:hypothetical protein
VLIELLTFFSNRGPHLRREAAAFVEHLRSSTPTVVIPQTPAAVRSRVRSLPPPPRQDVQHGRLYRHGRVPEGITDVLTADEDFAQEGLTVLLS